MILAGDVGGTKTLLALFHVEDGRPVEARKKRLASQEFDGLVAMLESFLEPGEAEEIESACVGVAGPVIDGVADPPNLPWDIDGDAVADSTGLERLVVINDLVAFGEGVPLLADDQLHSLQQGRRDEDGNRVVVAAGTGLGMALLPTVDGEPVVVSSEGGHTDFAPRNEDEINLLRHLQRRFVRVSNERVVSGPGILHIYEYLRDSGYAPEDPHVRQQIDEGEDAAKAISENALDGSCALSMRTLDLFVTIYGAVTGNLALFGMAAGGVYLGGGIAPKILDKLDDGSFISAFRQKGRYSDFMKRLPVEVILEPETALLGAARRALRMSR